MSVLACVCVCVCDATSDAVARPRCKRCVMCVLFSSVREKTAFLESREILVLKEKG